MYLKDKTEAFDDLLSKVGPGNLAIVHKWLTLFVMINSVVRR